MRVCKEERREWGLVIQRDWVWGQPDAIPHHKIFRRRKLAEWCVKLGRQIIVSTLFKKRYLSVSFVWAPSTIRNSVNNSMYRLHHFFNFSLLDKDAYWCPLSLGSRPCLHGFMLAFITTISCWKSFWYLHESIELHFSIIYRIIVFSMVNNK